MRIVDVVVVTTGVRDTLAEALRSVVAQDYPGPCSMFLVCDDRYGVGARVSDVVMRAVPGPDRLTVRRVSVAEDGQSLPIDPYARVAVLRNLALSLVTAPAGRARPFATGWAASRTRGRTAAGSRCVSSRSARQRRRRDQFA